MAASGLAPIISAVFAPATAGAGIGATIAGGLISGLGAGIMKGKERKDEERSRVAEEERRQASYNGAGEAVRFWDSDSSPENDTQAAGPEFQRVDAQSNNDLALGQREQPKKLGQQYRNQKPGNGRTFRYDPQKRAIVPA